MEVPLQQHHSIQILVEKYVSILVLMEVPLQPHPLALAFEEALVCFNPCFNGSSSSTKRHQKCRYKRNVVSILVLMEVPLQHWIGCTWKFNHLVSILVLMEVPLQLIPPLMLGGFMPPPCFNPCFNGSSSSTVRKFSIPFFVEAFQSLF